MATKTAAVAVVVVFAWDLAVAARIVAAAVAARIVAFAVAAVVAVVAVVVAHTFVQNLLTI